MHSPLARHLARFPGVVPFDALVPAAPVEAVPDEPTVTMTVAAFEARLATARREAHEAAQAAAERAIADMRSSCAASLAEATAAAAGRAEWVAREAERLDGGLDAAFATLREVIGDGIADALRPLLAEALVQRALAELGDALDRLLADPLHPPVVVRGPADLIAALARTSRNGLELQEADGDEIVVTADGARVETRLSAALAALNAKAA